MHMGDMLGEPPRKTSALERAHRRVAREPESSQEEEEGKLGDDCILEFFIWGCV